MLDRAKNDIDGAEKIERHQIAFREPCSTDLPQDAFARSIGVAKETLLNWEHGRRHPIGPAKVLLAMIARKPSLVSELLR